MYLINYFEIIIIVIVVIISIIIIRSQFENNIYWNILGKINFYLLISSCRSYIVRQV